MIKLSVIFFFFPLCSSDTLRSSRWEGASQLSASPQPLTLNQPEALQGDTAGSGTTPTPTPSLTDAEQLKPGAGRSIKGQEAEEEEEEETGSPLGE